MIKEALQYCFHYISCPQYIRKLGLLSDLIGIESRYSRCKLAWKSHLENSKRHILDAAQELKQRNRVIIFGAGSLHDVPLKELSELFLEVHLVDIFFLQGTLNEIKRYSNVEFHEVDITGVLKKALVGDIEILSSTTLPKHFVNDEFDLVISLNLLSQLPMAIKNYFEKDSSLSFDQALLTRFYKSLILNHLNFLRSFALKGSRVLLISDTEKQACSAVGEVLLTESSLEAMGDEIFSGFRLVDQWTWDLAPAGEIEQAYALELLVKVFKI